MEQQKIAPNIQSRTQLNPTINDISNTLQKNQKSLHSVTHLNAISKSKLQSGPQVVISYYFQNDTTSQTRTHNLLIGLQSTQQNHSKKNTLRRNVLHRVNKISNSHDKIKNTTTSSQHLKHQLIKVRSNQILKHNNDTDDTVVKSFYYKNENNKFPSSSINEASTHYNTFWKNYQYDEKGQSHEKYINSNIVKIGNRKSATKSKPELNIYNNAIQKVSRSKINQFDQKFKNQQLQTKNSQQNQLDHLSDHDVLEKNQIQRYQKHQKGHNDNIQSALHRVKREYTQQSLKNGNAKQETSKSKLTPLSQSIHRVKQTETQHENIPLNNNKNYISSHNPFIQYSSSKKQLFERKDKQISLRDEDLHKNQLKIEEDYSSSRERYERQQRVYTQGTMTLKKGKQTSKQFLNYQKALIEQQNQQKKRTYRKLIKNNGNPIPKKQRTSMAEQFHRIDSQNENESDLSKKQIENSIKQNQIPQKNINSSNNDLINKKPLNSEQFQNRNFNYPFPDKQIKINPIENNYWRTDQKNQTNRQNQNLNLILDPDFSSKQKQRQQNLTKRKIPSNYDDFIKLLSQQNQKKREIENLQKQQEHFLRSKTSRFKTLEAQNQHIKRVLNPIGHTFIEDRRKQHSEERQSNKSPQNSGKSNQFKNDNNIISNEVNKKSQQHFEKINKSQMSNFGSRDLNRSRSDTQHFESLLQNFKQRLNAQDNKNTNKMKERMAKLNSLDQNNQNNYINSSQDNQKEQKTGNNRFKKSHQVTLNKEEQQERVIGKLTCVKVPQQVIERTNSRLNKGRNSTPNNKRNFNQNNKNHSNTFSVNKKQKNLNQTGKSIAKNQPNVIDTKKRQLQNKLNKQKNSTGSLQKRKTQLKSNHQGQKQLTNSNKMNENKIGQPIDKRTAKQIQRKTKNWKNSSSSSQIKREQAKHQAKDKQIHKKDWKWAKKDRKDQQDDSYEQEDLNEQISGEETKQNGLRKKKEENSIKIRVQEGQDSENYQNMKDTNGNNKASKSKNRSLLDSEDMTKIQSNSDKQPKQKQIQDRQAQLYSKDKINSVANGEEIQKQNGHPNLINKDTEYLQEIQKKEKKYANIFEESLKDQHNQDNLNEHSNQQNLEAYSDINSSEIQQQLIKNRLSHGQQVDYEQPMMSSTEKKHQKFTTTLQNFMGMQRKNQKQKRQMIKQVIGNEDMEMNGFMEITQSKFEIYNHESQKSILSQTINKLTQTNSDPYGKRAQIVKFLYSLPQQYQQQIDNFVPNQKSDRLITRSSFYNIKPSLFKNVLSQKLRKGLQEILVYDKITSLNFKQLKKSQHQTSSFESKRRFFAKLFEPYQNLNGQLGVWLYCVGVWRLITVPKAQVLTMNQQFSQEGKEQQILVQSLERAIQKAIPKFYFNSKVEDLKAEQILKMLTGLKTSTLTKSRTNMVKIFKQIEYNSRKSHIIRAMSNLNDSKFSQQTINCVRKIETTPTGQKVIQIMSFSTKENDPRPRYFWIKEEKFLEFFRSFTIISKRSSQSYWSNTLIQVKNQDKAVYMIETSDKHTSGSITIYPFHIMDAENRQKCTIAFYKEIQPQVLKLIGRASQKLPENQLSVHNSKLYFEFNIKGTYFVFFELEDGQYNVAIQSTSSQSNLQFVEFVKKQTMKNEQCEYVEIDKIFRKKPKLDAFQNSQQFKQLLNFIKKTSPQVYAAK